VIDQGCGVNHNRVDNFFAMIASLTSQLHLARNRNNVNVPVKDVTLLVPPPFTCNNRAFNKSKGSNRSKLAPKDDFELKPYICITTNMTTKMIEETLKELILNLVDVDSDDFPMIDGDNIAERGRKRIKIVSADTDDDTDWI
jgi:hypothetical protein